MLIRDKDKEILQQLFSSIEIPVEVWAYGSRVDGTAHEGSDLDLVIRTHNLENIPLDIYLGIKEKIQESNIPFLVDLFDWARLPENFRRNIEQQHEILFCSI